MGALLANVHFVDIAGCLIELLRTLLQQECLLEYGWMECHGSLVKYGCGTIRKGYKNLNEKFKVWLLIISDFLKKKLEQLVVLFRNPLKCVLSNCNV